MTSWLLEDVHIRCELQQRSLYFYFSSEQVFHQKSQLEQK